MTTQVNLTFRRNQNWLLVYNVSVWALLYDLTKARFRMQLRPQAEDVLPTYSFDSSAEGTSARGVITYLATPQLLVVEATYADVRQYITAGDYAHDLTVEVYDPASETPDEPIVVRDIVAGIAAVQEGVTIR